jgi:hypothetical protein
MLYSRTRQIQAQWFRHDQERRYDFPAITIPSLVRWMPLKSNEARMSRRIRSSANILSRE